METNYVAKFTCDNCLKNFGVKTETGAVRCRKCNLFFIDWQCHKTNVYAKGHYKECHVCETLPILCKVCNVTPVKFGTCVKCWLATKPDNANNGVCLLD